MTWPEQALEAMLRWKAHSATLPEPARARGQAWIEEDRRPILTHPTAKVLPQNFAEYNLLPGIREAALERFRRHEIIWHMEVKKVWEGRPSPHILDSQIQCVNVLFGQTDTQLLALVQQVVPDAVALAEVEDGSPITFEWIGQEDYLGEARGKPRERGRYCTSADALLVAVRADGGRTGVLVEWKFTELYDKPVAVRTATTDRREVYRARYEADGSPFVERPALDVYFHEPHYQLFRQALLAGAMVDAREFGIDRTVMLHLVPGRHHALRESVPHGLREFGDTIEEVWTHLLPTSKVRYRMVDNQPLLRSSPEIAERYGELGS